MDSVVIFFYKKPVNTQNTLSIYYADLYIIYYEINKLNDLNFIYHDNTNDGFICYALPVTEYVKSIYILATENYKVEGNDSN